MPTGGDGAREIVPGKGKEREPPETSMLCNSQVTKALHFAPRAQELISIHEQNSLCMTTQQYRWRGQQQRSSTGVVTKHQTCDLWGSFATAPAKIQLGCPLPIMNYFYRVTVRCILAPQIAKFCIQL